MTDTRADEATAAAGHAPRGEATLLYRRYALFVLMLAYTMNFVDRQILAILLQPIKLDLGLSDSQLGLLSGLTFALFYVTLGIPIAAWADRANRRNIVALATAIFSGMTVLCGLAANYWQLCLARIGVAVGEAGSSPPAHSIISDLFPPQERARALGFYGLGVNIGILIGFLIGGWITQFYGWRTAFFVVGLPGLIIALLVRLTIKEPLRGHAEGRHGERHDAPRIRDVIAMLWSQRSFRQLAAGGSLTSFAGYSGITWMPAYLARNFEMQSGEIGTSLALILGLIGASGTYLAAVFADRLGQRDMRWNMWVLAIICVAAFPFAAGVYLTDNALVALLCFGAPSFAAAAYIGPAFAMTHALVTLRMRAVSSAVLLFIINLIGLGLGPLVVGVLSDVYAPRFGDDSLRFALLSVVGVWLWAATHLWLAAKSLRSDAARAAA